MSELAQLSAAAGAGDISGLESLMSPLTLRDYAEHELFLQRIPFERVKRQERLTPSERQALLLQAGEQVSLIGLETLHGIMLSNSAAGIVHRFWLMCRHANPELKFEEAADLVPASPKVLPKLLDLMKKVNGEKEIPEDEQPIPDPTQTAMNESNGETSSAT